MCNFALFVVVVEMEEWQYSTYFACHTNIAIVSTGAMLQYYERLYLLRGVTKNQSMRNQEPVYVSSTTYCSGSIIDTDGIMSIDMTFTSIKMTLNLPHQDRRQREDELDQWSVVCPPHLAVPSSIVHR